MEFIPDRLDYAYGPGEMPDVKDFAAHHPELESCNKFLNWYEETKVNGYGNVRDCLIEYCKLDVSLLAQIIKTLSLYIYRKIAKVKVLFAHDIRTLAKCSLCMWLYFNFCKNDGEIIELYGPPRNYRYQWMWTSNFTKIVLSFLERDGKLRFHDPCTNVFCSSENDDHGYLLLDCTHFACPKTTQYDDFYPHNNKIRIGKVTMERD